MNNQHRTRNTIIVLSVLAFASAGVFFAIKTLFPALKQDVPKSQKVEYILAHSGGSGSYDGLMGLGNEFIDAWYFAVKNKKSKFVVNNNTFSSVTGKQI